MTPFQIAHGSIKCLMIYIFNESNGQKRKVDNLNPSQIAHGSIKCLIIYIFNESNDQKSKEAKLKHTVQD